MACIGLERHGDRATIKHIATSEHARGLGLGRRLVQGAIETFALRHLEAETDAAAVGFYRACGFQVSSLGEKYPGVERFRCTFDAIGDS